MAEKVPGSVVQLQTELQGHRRLAGQVGVVSFPDLAEATLAQEQLKFPVGAADRPVAGLEPQASAVGIGAAPAGDGVASEGWDLPCVVSTPTT